MWGVLVSLVLVTASSASTLENEERRFTIYETPEKIMSHGYPAERHHVTTEDGYILEMHRMPYGRQHTNNVNRPPVFLMHGLLASSNSYIAIGPRSGVGYNLADAGFDVWMGNARGTRNSRQHVSLDPDHETEKLQFFDFSWEEIGMIDVAAMVDYILDVTGREQLHYIGHSQGGTSFLVLASMRPEYNDKLKSVHLLAGVGNMEYFPNTPLRVLARFSNSIYALGVRAGIVELYPSFLTLSSFNSTKQMSILCSSLGTEGEQICRDGFDELIGNVIDVDSNLALGGASLKQIAHYGHNIRDKVYSRFNYGNRNMEIYGQPDPPSYNLSLITADVTMHYTVSDNLLDERDVLAMAAVMPNTVVQRVARDSFSHVDFVAADDSKELVTDYIIDAIWDLEGREEFEESEELEGENGGTDAPDSSTSLTSHSSLLCLCLLVYSLRIIHKI